MLAGLNCHLLAGFLGERPLIKEIYRELRAPNKQVLSRHPSRGKHIGLGSWHAKTISANQDLVCRSLYVVELYSAAKALNLSRN